MIDITWEKQKTALNIFYESIGYIILDNKRYDVFNIIIERCFMWDWIDIKLNKTYNSNNTNLSTRRLREFNEYKEIAEDVYVEEITFAKFMVKTQFELPKELQRKIKIKNFLADD